MTYVIKCLSTWISKKTGLPIVDISYFAYHQKVMGLGFNTMVGHTAAAKKYEFISDARRDMRLYFGNSKRNSIVKLSTPKINPNASI